MKPLPPMLLADDFIEHSAIAWRGEPGMADPEQPVLQPEYPWDSGATFSHGTALKDPIDGLYKLWYLSTPKSWYNDRQLTYAVSEDGVNFTKPMLDIYPCDGHDKTNILLGMGMGGQVSQVSVFVHPEAEPSRRYEMFCYRHPEHQAKTKAPGYDCPDKKIAGIELPAGFDVQPYGLYRHYSEDGIHWNAQTPPVAGQADTQAAYGEQVFTSSDGLSIFQLRDGRYVCHNKVELSAIPGGFVPYDIAAGNCRTMARRESPDGWQWADTYESILTPDWRDPADTQFLELMMNQYNDGFIAVATVYHCMEQTIELQLAGSKDGRRWFRPTRRPAVALKPLGDLGGGMLWPMRGFVIEDGRAYLYYAGLKGLHGDIYSKTETCEAFEGAMFRASWELGRMWAAIHHSGNEETAYLTAKPDDHLGKTLYVNAMTFGDGKIEAEMVDDQLKPIAGYTREACRPVRGDDKCAALTWKQHDTAACEGALLRIYLTDARLYGYEWR